MRTTIDIDDVLMHELQVKAVQEKKTLKALVNTLLATALRKTGQGKKKKRWKCASYDLGGSSFPYEQAWKVIEQLEIEAVSEKLELRK